MAFSISDENIEFYKTLFTDKEANVYAILDGASVPDIVSNLALFNAESICLYRGKLDPELAQTAPYLVLLTNESKLTNWILSGIGQHWGIFAVSNGTIREMRKHFRTFLMVYDPEGVPIYFRYYDPRVLRVFLPTCNKEEKKKLFGPIDKYYAESEDCTSLMAFNEDVQTSDASNAL